METAPDGSGTVVPAQSIAIGNFLTVFAVGRDASNGFIGNVQAESWSLVNITGGVVAGDLVEDEVFTEFTIPTSGSTPQGIVTGPDGNLWFTEYSGNKIGRITRTGVITEFSVPTASSGPWHIVVGPDGNLWFAEYAVGKLARITTAGAITEYAVGASTPQGLASGPDGNLWFTEVATNKIGRMTTSGTGFTEFSIPTTNSLPRAITPGPDGSLWFLEGAGKVGRITTAGVVTEFPIAWNSSPTDIVAGADGNLWFVESGTATIGRITTAGVITEFVTSGTLFGIGAGPDGNVWFTAASKIGRVTPAGVITRFSVPSSGSNVLDIVAGPEGALWFVEQLTGRVGRAGSKAVFTAHASGSAAVHTVKSGFSSVDSGTLTVPP